MEENSQDDYLPFSLDDDSSGPEGSPSFVRKKSSMKSTYGFSPIKKLIGGPEILLLDTATFQIKWKVLL